MDDASRAELDELTAQLRDIRLDLESQRHHSAHSPQSYSKTSAFIVDAERLKWLDKILSNVPGQRKYDVRTSDGNTSNFDNFEDVLNFPNTKSKGINEIRINITEDYMDNMDLSIKGDRRSDNLRYRISGSVENGFQISSDLNEWMEEVRPWYSRIATADFIVLLFVVVVSILVGLIAWAFYLLLIYVMTHDLSEPLPEGPKTGWSLLLTVFVNWFWVIPFILGIPLNLIRHHLFPVGTFAIGQGRSRHERTVWWRNLIFGVIFLGLIISALGSWLVSK